MKRAVLTILGILTYIGGAAAQEVLHSITEPGAVGLGTDVACAGDVNADGFDDLVVGDGNTGAVYVYSGATGAKIHTLVAPSGSPPAVGSVTPGNSGYGYAVDGAGDVNGDGFADIVAGAGPVLAGGVPEEVTIFSGLDGSPLVVIPAPAPATFFGLAVAGIGDVDGDGLDDIAVGAALRSTGGLASNGAVDVFSGTGTLLFSVSGTQNAERLGESVARAGDVDGDGTPDFVAGSRQGDGSAVVFSGAGGAILATYDPQSTVSNATFFIGNFNPLANVGPADDVNGDGVTDFVLGRPIDATGGFNAGAVFVFSGTNGAVIATHIGAPCDRLGIHVSLGDVSGDGRADIVAGKANDLGQLDRVSVYSGATGLAMFDTSTFANDATQAAIAGDVNGDGYPDIVVGSDPFGPSASQVTVLGGGPAAGPAAAPTLSPAAGDVLSIDGESGGPVRRVDRGVFQSLSIEVAQPVTNPMPANYVVFGLLGHPPEDHAFSVPGVGDLAVTPQLASPNAPWLFVLADTWGVLPSLVPAQPGGMTLSLSAGVPTALDVTLQGVIEQSPGVLRTTNGVLLRIE